MKKSLVALAALAATTAFAQSSVTISGNADVAYANKEAINGTGAQFLKSTGVGDGANVPNRIILTVTEDLGGGLKAQFVNEHGISPTNVTDWGVRANNGAPILIGSRAAATADNQISGDSAVTTGTNRGTYVALSGGFGEVRAGYLVSSFYNLSSQSGHLLAAEQYGGQLHTLGLGEVGGARANGWQYTTPTFNGLKATVQQQTGAEREWEAAGTNQAYTKFQNNRTAFRVDYKNGGLDLGIANTSYKVVREGANGVTLTNVFGVVSTTNASNANTKASITQVVGSYTMGDIKLTFSNNSGKHDDTTDNTKDRDFSGNSYGAQYTMGKARLYYVGGSGKVKSPTATVNNLKQTQYGVRYDLSKRTTAYVMIGETKDTAVTGATQISKGKFNAIGLSHAF